MAPTNPTHSLVEPHPRPTPHRQRAMLSSGRGGAGNYAKYDTATLTDGPCASGPARPASVSTTASSSTHISSASSALSASSASSQASTPTTSQKSKASGRMFTTGIGGAGNARPADERRIFSFDEELERQTRLARNAAEVPVFHVGRGGAGNRFSEVVPGVGRGGAGSVRSVESVRSGASRDSGGSTDSRLAVEKAKRSFERVTGRLSRVLARE